MNLHPLDAPHTAREIVGRVLVVAGPAPGKNHYAAWHSVWIHQDGGRRVTWPRAALKIRDPETKFVWIKPLKSTFIEQ